MDQLKQDTKFLLEECYSDVDKIGDLEDCLAIKHTVTDLMLRLKEMTNETRNV